MHYKGSLYAGNLADIAHKGRFRRPVRFHGVDEDLLGHAIPAMMLHTHGLTAAGFLFRWKQLASASR